MKFQPRKPPRYQQDYSIYFLTFCTFKRLPMLHAHGIPEFQIEELHFYEQKIQKLVAYTIMPEHVHLMVEVENADSLSRFLRDFKKYTSAAIMKRIVEEAMSSRRSSDRRAEPSREHRSDDRLLPHVRRFDNRLLHRIAYGNRGRWIIAYAQQGIATISKCIYHTYFLIHTNILALHRRISHIIISASLLDKVYWMSSSARWMRRRSRVMKCMSSKQCGGDGNQPSCEVFLPPTNSHCVAFKKKKTRSSKHSCECSKLRVFLLHK
jgi:REP element-mobilizing transposase RayT